MQYFVLKEVTCDVNGNDVKTEYFVIDADGNKIAGPCSLKDAIEIARYLNELNTEDEERIALEQLKLDIDLEKVKAAVAAHQSTLTPS